MSYNQELYDRIVQHLADVRLYEMESHVLNDRSLRRHQKRLGDLLRRNIKSDVSGEVNRAVTELHSNTSRAIDDFSTASVTFHSNNLDRSVGGFFRVQKPVAADMAGEIVGPNIGLGKPLREHFNNIGSGELTRIQNIVGRGLAENKPQKEIIAAVMKTTTMTQNQVSALVRTSITNTESIAVDRVIEANKDIVYGYRFTAVLDSRTSAVCSFHDGKVFEFGDNRYRPPLHWNCRSSMVPVIKSKSQLEKEKSAWLKPTALAAVDAKLLSGAPAAVETYSGWLRRQPMAVKLGHLGDEDRVSLFEKGILEIKEFFSAVGKAISIQRLRKLDNARTSIFPITQADKTKELVVAASRPYDILRSVDVQNQLRDLYITDSVAANQAMSLTDYRGTSLPGKRSVRTRANNVFDERNQQFDPFTGEIKTTLLYDPDFSVYQERLDFMKNSKVLTADQKTFIEEFAESLEDKIGVNNQSVVVENLRLLFERYSNKKEPWENFATLARKEAQFSVVNVSRILDRRSRESAQLFDSFGSGEDAKVQILGRYFSFQDLADNMLSNQRYVQEWAERYGRLTAQDSYLSGRVPLKAYFIDPDKTEPLVSVKAIKKDLNKRLDAGVKDIPGAGRVLSFIRGEPTEGVIEEFLRGRKESWRSLVDLELNFFKKKRSYKDKMLSSVLKNDRAIQVIAKAMKTVASGTATDYDSIAIGIGKTLRENWQPAFPWHKPTLQDFHSDGSKILEGLRQQGKIRVLSRGRVRRATVDLETGRASGEWRDTVSREVTILDKDMLELQSRSRQVLLAQRVGNVSDRDRLFVIPNKKTYYDARGRDTGISLITRRASENYDKILVDQDFADMLNHSMDVKYIVDDEFAGFMDELVRFRDPRGNVAKFDELNNFRKLIIQRGDQGYGLMQTIKWHRKRGEPFRVAAKIDGRGRVYFEGYLSPTGGEVVRPFLNSAVSRRFGQTELRELMTQTGSLLGPATEALTQAGRTEIFLRNEKSLLQLGNLLLSKTQRDQKIRDFLEHPIVAAMDAEEVPKLTRFALEYARVHQHVGGDFSKLDIGSRPYMSQLMVENDASSSGAQIIGLSTRDRSISINSNVLATTKKNRLYDLVAMDTVADPEFQALQAFRGANITWEDLQKAAKAQNMVSFYGAGKATQAANIEDKFAAVLGKKGYTVITRPELRNITSIIDKSIKDAEYIDATNVVTGLKNLKKELIEVVNGEIPVGKQLLRDASDLHPDVTLFIEKLTDVRVGIVGPEDFKKVSEIMSRQLAVRAPITQKFVQFWNSAAKAYVEETQAVDIPWVTFDKKTLFQRYRPKIQTSIEFYDAESRRMVRNIYEDSAKDSSLLGKASVSRARIGMGVNGNHMNDASIVRQFLLWGKRNNVPSATIHDAFFTNIGDVGAAKVALREIYADAVESETIRNTLSKMKELGLSEKSYQELLKKGIEDGLIDPPNSVTREDILRAIPKGWDWYGIGP